MNYSVILKNILFTDCISKIKKTQLDNSKDLDVVMPIHDLIEYSNNYSETSGSLYRLVGLIKNTAFTF